MLKVFGGISAAAGALTGVVKIAGLVTGNKWLGHNWHGLLHYFFTFAMAGYAIGSVVVACVPRSKAKVPPSARAYSAMLAGFCGLIAGASFGDPGSWPFGAVLLAILLAIVAVSATIQVRKRTKTCPDCKESIKASANVCRYCGFRFSPRPSVQDEAPVSASADVFPAASQAE